MLGGAGFAIVIGVLVIFAVTSGRAPCMSGFFGCLANGPGGAQQVSGTPTLPASTVALGAIPIPTSAGSLSLPLQPGQSGLLYGNLT